MFRVSAMVCVADKRSICLAVVRATLLSLAVLLGACSTGGNAPWGDQNELGAFDSGMPKLAPGDRLRVTVFDEQELSGTYAVAGDGTVAMPLIGRVKASDATLEAFRGRLTARLASGYLKNPKVSVSVENYRPFFVHGEVRQGGEFKFKPDLSFRDAIATAGGYSYRADENYVLLTRRGSNQPVKIPMPNKLIVHPGDNIRVPERFF